MAVLLFDKWKIAIISQKFDFASSFSLMPQIIFCIIFALFALQKDKIVL